MIPIYRAKKIESDEPVDGQLVSETLLYTKGNETTSDKYEVKDEEWFITSKNGYNYDLIDPSTLEISFDNGITWDWVEHVSTVMFLHHEEE